MKTKSKIKAEYEYTDTSGGKPNYSWVKRGKVEATTSLGIIRKAKAAVGLSGIRCRKEDYFDSIHLKPAWYTTILFITFLPE